MASATPQEQTQQSLEQAKARKGSQRFTVFAYVDNSQYVKFKVPEWVGKLAGENSVTEWANSQPAATDKEFVPKKYTGTTDSSDENFQAPGTTGTKVKRQSGKYSSNYRLRKYHRQVRFELKPGHGQKRGTKEYKFKSIRMPTVLNSRAIQLWLKTSPIKDKVIAFYLQSTRYAATNDADLTKASLGQLRSENVASTTR